MKAPIDGPGRKDWSMMKVMERLSRLRSFLVTSLLWILLIATAYLVYDGLISQAFIVEPISTPNSLESRGYGPTILANWIVDRMQDIQTKALTRKEMNSLATDASQVDIEVPGSGISVRTFNRLLKKVLGITERKISGEIVELATPERFRMHLRVSAASEGARFIEIEGSIEDLINAAAEEATKSISPYLLAAYHYQTLPSDGSYIEQIEDTDSVLDELNDLIDLCLSNEESEDDAWGLNLRGAILDRKGRHSQAVEYYRRASELSPEFASAHWNWSGSLLNLAQHDEALAHYRIAIDFDPTMRDQGAVLLENIGRAFHNAGRESDAASQYEDVLQLIAEIENDEPSWRRQHAIVLSYVGENFYELSRDFVGDDPDLLQSYKERMIEAYRRAINLNPRDSRLYHQLGSKFSFLGEYDKAFEQYREALVSDPRHLESFSTEICTSWNGDLKKSLESRSFDENRRVRGDYKRMCDWVQGDD